MGLGVCVIKSIIILQLMRGIKKTCTHKLTSLHWYRRDHFLQHTEPELDRHAVPAARSVPAVPGKQTSGPW